MNAFGNDLSSAEQNYQLAAAGFVPQQVRSMAARDQLASQELAQRFALGQAELAQRNQMAQAADAYARWKADNDLRNSEADRMVRERLGLGQLDVERERNQTYRDVNTSRNTADNAFRTGTMALDWARLLANNSYQNRLLGIQEKFGGLGMLPGYGGLASRYADQAWQDKNMREEADQLANYANQLLATEEQKAVPALSESLQNEWFRFGNQDAEAKRLFGLAKSGGTVPSDYSGKWPEVLSSVRTQLGKNGMLVSWNPQLGRFVSVYAQPQAPQLQPAGPQITSNAVPAAIPAPGGFRVVNVRP